MKNINMKLDLNADPKTIGLFGIAVFVASRAGARRVTRRVDQRPRPYGDIRTRYNQMSPRRSTVSGGMRNYLRETFIDVIDRGIHPPPPAPIYRRQPIDTGYGEHVRIQRALDQINSRLDAMLEIMPDKKETFRNEGGRGESEAVVETKDGIPISVLMDSVEEVKSLIDAMADRAESYEAATVSDLYDLLGLPTQFIDSKWGWTHTNDFAFEVEDDKVRLILPPSEKL